MSRCCWARSPRGGDGRRLRFPIDPLGGQKTGWFFDQRDNRRSMAGLAKDARVLDVYSYSGGFGVLAATQGAQVGDLHRPLPPALTRPSRRLT